MNMNVIYLSICHQIHYMCFFRSATSEYSGNIPLLHTDMQVTLMSLYICQLWYKMIMIHTYLISLFIAHCSKIPRINSMGNSKRVMTQPQSQRTWMEFILQLSWKRQVSLSLVAREVFLLLTYRRRVGKQWPQSSDGCCTFHRDLL